MLWELFTQCGPVASVSLPRDRVSGKHQSYGFIEFRYERDADYATKIMNMIKLFEQPINIKMSREGTKTHDIGANIFIGNLDEAIDEDMLYNTFGMFGGMVKQPKIPSDAETGKRRNFGLVFYDSFEASDNAISAMNGQFLGARQITVQYAYKQDSPGQRHGSQAERLLAAEVKKQQGAQVLFRPNTNFAKQDGIAVAPPAAQAIALGIAPPMIATIPTGVPPPPLFSGIPPPPLGSVPPPPLPGVGLAVPPPPLPSPMKYEDDIPRPPPGPPPLG